MEPFLWNFIEISCGTILAKVNKIQKDACFTNRNMVSPTCNFNCIIIFHIGQNAFRIFGLILNGAFEEATR